jgi:hypothetical protein
MVGLVFNGIAILAIHLFMRSRKMEQALVEGNLGTVGQYDLEFKGGKLVGTVKAAVSVGEVSMGLSIDSAAICDAIAKAIPGSVDDALLAVLKAALKEV